MSKIVICTRPECQTTAGCICAASWRLPQPLPMPPSADLTDTMLVFIADLKRQLTERDAEIGRWRSNYQNAWQALRMIREAVEWQSVGALPSEDAVLALSGPEPIHEAEHIVAAIMDMRSEGEAAIARADRAEALLAEAVKAIEPFAKVADSLTKSAYGPAWGFNGAVIEHEDFRRARSFLASTEK